MSIYYSWTGHEISCNISSPPLPPHIIHLYSNSPFTCILPSLVALITPIHANPKSPIPIIALGLINNVKQNNTAVTKT